MKKDSKILLFERMAYLNPDFKLNEGVELINVDGEEHYFRGLNEDTYAFSLYDDQLLLSDKNGTHGDAIIKNFNLKLPKDEEMFYKIKKKTKLWGRIWINLNTISFWDDRVSNNDLNLIKNELEEYFPNEKINNYNIELD